MKVIDLLNKIANGEEVPKKIQVYSDIFVFDDSNGVYEHEKTRTNLLSIYNGNILDYEVRIIEEDKKIEKLEIVHNGSANSYALLNEYGTKCGLTKHSKVMCDKINEIIDYLEENKND